MEWAPDLTPYIQEIEEFNKFERRVGSTVAVYSCDVLTCLATLKCGSSFFSNQFGSQLRWPKIVFNDINWERSHVFSAIIDPLTRRYKAIAQWLDNRHLGKEFYINEELQNIVLNTVLLDIHSYGYEYNYGEYCDQIDWIPIDLYNRDQSYSVLLTLLDKHLISPPRRAPDSHSNISIPARKKLEMDIKEMFEANPNQEIMDYLAKDIELYNKVISKFNTEGKTWDEMSWLRE